MENSQFGMKGPGILFVCTANICRSPMAQALFIMRLKKIRQDWRDWRIESAGTWALDGRPASRYTQLVVAQHGMDISSHRARTVNSELLSNFDLILTMEPGHKEAIQVEFPEIASRVYMLSEMEGNTNPIDDPYGKTVEDYEITAQLIDRILGNGLERIISLAGNRSSIK